MSKRSLIWKIPTALIGIILGVVIVMLIVVGSVLYVQPIRTKVMNKGVGVANEKTDYDIDLGRAYLSPFHHSPTVLYRAYKGEADLPIEVQIDSLFVGHRGQDTLLYSHTLRLKATIQTANRTEPFSDFTSLPIVVEQLLLDQTTVHSDSLIEAVGIDAVVGQLALSSPEILIAQGQYPLHGLRLFDADIAIDLRSTPDTTEKDTTPTLMAFDVPDGELRNIRFRLTPLNMDIQTHTLSTNVLADVGAKLYDARRIDIGGLNFALGNLSIPADTVYGDARVSLNDNQITSNSLHAYSSQMGAKADLRTTKMDLNTMCVNVIGDAEYQGSKAQLRAIYDIDDEIYNATVHIDRVNLTPFLKDSTRLILAGDIIADGKGLNPRSRAMKSQVALHLTNAVYDNIDVSGITLNAALANQALDGTLHLPVNMTDKDMQVKAQTEHQFSVSDFLSPHQMTVDYHTQMHNIRAQVAGEKFRADQLILDFATDSTTALNLITDQFRLTAHTPMHVMTLVDTIQPLLKAVSDSAFINSITSLTNLTLLDTLRHFIPDMDLLAELRHGSPVQHIIERTGIDIQQLNLALLSNPAKTDIALNASIPDINHPDDSAALRLPPVKAAVKVTMTEGNTFATLNADTRLTDGAMTFYNLCTDAALRLNIARNGTNLHGNGQLTLDSIAFNNIDLGNRNIDLQLSSSKDYSNALRADVQLDDLPLELVNSFVSLTDIDLDGAIRATASIDGLPARTDISAEVYPLEVRANYIPYNVGIALGATPIIMKHNHIDLNGLPVYAADSTYLALYGGLDLDSMRLNVNVVADSLAPVKLTPDGSFPVYGDLATDIRGRVTGPLDSIVADVDIIILPTTDITYPIDKKNLAQVKPYGTVNVRYITADSVPLALGGRINVDDGIVKYSPKAYPVMPFKVDSGSNVAFNGPLGKTQLNVSASQKVKADVDSKGAGARRVNFTTGVRVKGELDSIGINSLGFFLEAPGDEAVSRELAAADEGTREGLAAMLLTTGMYLGQTNEAAQKEGYALSSIVNSRINAAISNSKMGKFMDVDFSAGSKKTDITLSKSFLDGKLRLTIGSSISDNPEENETKGLLSNISADYKLTKDGNVSLRLYSKRDKNNVLEGELYKSGIGIRTNKEWKRLESYQGDSLFRTHGFTADAGLVYRSNNSLGPDLSLKYALKNVLGKGETFTLKGNGAYYWALRNRHPGDPKKTDTYKLGVNSALTFPYLHWAGDNNPDGDTKYMLGYQYENIAGGYGVHKLTGGFTYFFHSEQNPYITHAFTPFNLSVVKMKAESANLLDKAAEYPQLIKVIAGDEFSPTIGYNFTYNDYRSKRPVNTFLDLGIKEAGNLINAIYCAFGRKWDDMDKPLGNITFNQFVKLSAELRNKYNLTDQVSIATRLFAGANIPLGNSLFAPLSESFYAGGPQGMRAAAPYAYGPGNFYSAKYNQNFFHAGDVKLEANLELRFPIVWKIYGAAFLDAGNVWSWYSLNDLFKAAGYENYLTVLEIPQTLYDGLYNNPEFAKQIALGTGAGLRLDLDGLVVRLDLGVAIHSPYQMYQYDKQGKPDTTKPITTYYNIPSFYDALRFNFGIGYPF